MTVEARWMVWPGDDDEHYPVMELNTPDDVDAMISANSDPAADVARLIHRDTVTYIERDDERLTSPNNEIFAVVKESYGYLSYQDARVPKHYSVGDPDSPGFESEDEQYPPGSGLALELFKQAIVEFMKTTRRPTCIYWRPWGSMSGDTHS